MTADTTVSTNVKANAPVPSWKKYAQFATPHMVAVWTWQDVVMLILVSPLGLMYFFLYYLFTFLILPTLCIMISYANCRKKPVRRLEGCGFTLLTIILLFTSAPALILLWIWVFFIFIYIHMVSIPIGIFRAIFLCEAGNIIKSWGWVIHYSQVMPFYRWGDVCRAITGGLHRQGLLEYLSLGKPFTGGIGSLLISPVLKYGFVTNPWVWNLDEVFCNQWSPALHGDPPKLVGALQDFIGTALHKEEDRRNIDNDRFAAHYPIYSGNSSKVVIGAQFGNYYRMPLLTLTTHELPMDKIPKERIEFTGMERDAFFVQLFYTNPFHFLTGDVYVDRRTDMKFEHPMYCIVPKKCYLGMLFYGNVNEMFRVYAPTDASAWIEEKVVGEQITDPIP